jgi:hypothetical protein
MEIWKIGLLAMAGIIAIAIMSNQIAIAAFIFVAGLVGLAIYLYTKRDRSIDPLEEFKQQLLRESFNAGNQLRYLKLSGGKHDEISHQERILGKIIGYTEIINKPDKSAKAVKSEWNNFYIFVYNPTGDNAISKIKDFVFSLPLLGGFKQTILFAANPSQVRGNDITSGDIIINGTAVTSVGIFQALNAHDLDKEYIMNFLRREAGRITLTDNLRKLSRIVDRAIESDSSHLKIKELLGQEKEEKQDTLDMKQGT